MPPCEPEIILDFSLRRWRLLEILLGYDVVPSLLVNLQQKQETPTIHHTIMGGLYDIIAVEEIDRYTSFFQPLLSLVGGYEGIFIPKLY
jgi:hypothetical protein